MKLHYTKDQDGKDILCDESGDKQVMMEWEKEYMEECIKRLQPRGHVLEIGFGFGYSATAIVNSPGVKEYTVIDCSPEVWKNFENFKQKYDKNIKINLVRGRWEDMMYTLGKFDSCFFDDYQMDGGDAWRFDDKFLGEFMQNHAIIGTRLGLYSTSDLTLTTEKHSSYLSRELEDYDVVIPEHCRYAKKVCIPILTKFSDDVLPSKQHAQPRLVGGFNFKAAPYISMEGKCIKIYNEFVDNTQTFEKKVQTLCGKDVRECMLTPEFNIHTYTQGLVCILFSDKEKSEDCALTFNGNITVKNKYNTVVMFKDSVITHTITEPIKVYLFYL